MAVEDDLRIRSHPIIHPSHPAPAMNTIVASAAVGGHPEAMDASLRSAAVDEHMLTLLKAATNKGIDGSPSATVSVAAAYGAASKSKSVEGHLSRAVETVKAIVGTGENVKLTEDDSQKVTLAVNTMVLAPLGIRPLPFVTVKALQRLKWAAEVIVDAQVGDSEGIIAASMAPRETCPLVPRRLMEAWDDSESVYCSNALRSAAMPAVAHVATRLAVLATVVDWNSARGAAQNAIDEAGYEDTGSIVSALIPTSLWKGLDDKTKNALVNVVRSLELERVIQDTPTAVATVLLFPLIHRVIQDSPFHYATFAMFEWCGVPVLSFDVPKTCGSAVIPPCVEYTPPRPGGGTGVVMDCVCSATPGGAVQSRDLVAIALDCARAIGCDLTRAVESSKAPDPIKKLLAGAVDLETPSPSWSHRDLVCMASVINDVIGRWDGRYKRVKKIAGRNEPSRSGNLSPVIDRFPECAFWQARHWSAAVHVVVFTSPGTCMYGP